MIIYILIVSPRLTTLPTIGQQVNDLLFDQCAEIAMTTPDKIANMTEKELREFAELASGTVRKLSPHLPRPVGRAGPVCEDRYNIFRDISQAGLSVAS